MNAKHDEAIVRLCNEIASICGQFPTGKRNMILNRLGQIKSRSSKISAATPVAVSEINDYTQEQIAARYIAKQAILNAMIAGRHISFLDSKEFGVSEMHTQMHCIARDIESKQLPYTLHREWFEFAPGKRAKMYHLTAKEA